MKTKNILTAYDFILPHNTDYIKKEMGVVGTRLVMELRGESVISIEEPKNKKTIAVTRSFEKNITQFNDLKERISTFATVCSEKLRKQKSCCYTIIIFIRKDKYKEQEQPYSFYKSKTLPYPTNTAFTISQTAIEMLKEIYTENQIYKKAGVIVTQLIPEDQKQFNLFEEENPKLLKLTNVIDLINSKNGKRIIKLGNQDMERTWKMKQNHLSNKYTTNINEILKVKC
jgi:DNA polymerase V